MAWAGGFHRALPERNLVSAIFRLESSHGPAEIREVTGLLRLWLDSPAQDSRRQSVVEWLRRVLLPRRLPGSRLPEVHDLEEIDSMLAERVEEWTRSWRAQGIADGRAVGLAEGRADGQSLAASTILLRLLARRLGDIPADVTVLIESADLQRREAWAGRCLDARSVDEVFAA